MREKNPRMLLAKVREGDYAHPGDTVAIDLMLEHFKTHRTLFNLSTLDVGCGRGGTADYIKKRLGGESSVGGIDIYPWSSKMRLLF